MVDPTVVWFPHHASQVRDYLDASKKGTDFRHQVDQYVCRELASVKYIFASGASNASDGEDYYTTVVIKATGADCEGVFDIVDGEKLAKYFTNPATTPSALMKR